jgi:hypothetical protein
MVSTAGMSRTPQGPARPGRRVDWRRAPKNLTTSLIDIDVALTDIVFHSAALDRFGDRHPPSVVDYAIEGVVLAGGSVGDSAEAAQPFLVYISGYHESDRLDWDEDIDRRSICYIATDPRPSDGPHSNIYIEHYLFRRLVELYASKRIDSARISIVLKVLQDSSGAIELPTSSHAMLRTSGDRHRHHSRAHLMSVQTSLGAGRTQRQDLIKAPLRGNIDKPGD